MLFIVDDCRVKLIFYRANIDNSGSAAENSPAIHRSFYYVVIEQRLSSKTTLSEFRYSSLRMENQNLSAGHPTPSLPPYAILPHTTPFYAAVDSVSQFPLCALGLCGCPMGLCADSQREDVLLKLHNSPACQSNRAVPLSLSMGLCDGSYGPSQPNSKGLCVIE